MALPLAALAKKAGQTIAQSAAGRAKGARSSDGGLSLPMVAVGGVALVVTVLVAVIAVVVVGAVSMLSAISTSTAGAAALAQNACDTNTGSSNPSAEASSDIPAVALEAYRNAGAATGIDWTFIAAIGKVESNHGRHGGRHLDGKGNVQPSKIIGIPLNGKNGTQKIADTDKGKLDGDRTWDRAVGIVQFIPTTWKAYAKDGNHDGVSDPQNVFDGALATGFYLKASGAPGDMYNAIWAYNHSNEYVANVLAQAEKYQGGTLGSSGDADAAESAVTSSTKATTASVASTSANAKTKDDKDDGKEDGKTATTWVFPYKVKVATLSGFAKPGTWAGGWGLAKGQHQGQDYQTDDGTPIYAIGDGTVMFSPSNEGWAGPNLVQVDHGNGVVSWYAHMDSRAPGIKAGAKVTAGQQVGTQGKMGRAFGQRGHLHLQITVNDIAIDPVPFLAGAGVPDGTVGSDACGPTGSSGVVGGNGQWGGHENGKIPASALCKVDFQNVYLECKAAAALNLLNEAYKAKFNRSLGDNAGVGGYRSYEEQVICRRDKGALCAVPGTSNHGWGLAADFSNGHFQSYLTADYQWMLKNAPNYGWENPKWAQNGGSKKEPWHFEFTATGLNT